MIPTESPGIWTGLLKKKISILPPFEPCRAFPTKIKGTPPFGRGSEFNRGGGWGQTAGFFGFHFLGLHVGTGF